MPTEQIALAAATAEPSARPERAQEAELKLLASKETLVRLREAPVIVRHARNSGTTRRLDAIYYDTPDQALYRNGLSLRVRRNGRRYVQTLKRTPDSGSPFTRDEWETPVAGADPELNLLPAAELGALPDPPGAGGLMPVFATRVRRRMQRLDFAGSVVEVAFDDGVIESGERREQVSEVELELKSGAPRALYDLGLELVKTAGLRIGTRSKADRGYGIAFDLSPQPVKAAVPPLSSGCTVDDIIAVLLGACQEQLLANQAVAEAARDTEGVHQMRVALRRLRTALAVLKRELALPALQAFDDDAKWLARLLGAARDWDVFVTDTLAGPAEALGAAVDFDALRQAVAPHREAAYAALRDAFGSERYNRFHLSLQRWISSRGWRNELAGQPLVVLVEDGAAFSGRVLGRLHRKVLRQGRHFARLPPEARHDVRLGLKKLRYAVEFFQELHGTKSEAKKYIQCIARLQDTLGHQNDALTTLPRLHALADGVVTHEAERSIGAVMGWQARDRLAANTTLRKQWRRFKALAPIWTN